MNSMMTVKEASAVWNIFDTRITKLCREGRIKGAVKQGKTWLIPRGLPKPEDLRFSDSVKPLSLLPPPVGISDFKKAVKDFYYVDKTMLIKDFLDRQPEVILFTRPRRFGKTLNMSMLRTFFEINNTEDTSVYFSDKKIWYCGEKYRKYQGKFPVIFLSFKDIRCDRFSDILILLKEAIAHEFSRHKELQTSDKCYESDRDYFIKVKNKELEDISLTMSLQILSRMLHMHYGEKTVIIIDEYDIPIQSGYLNGFYREITVFMRNLLSSCLKDNESLQFGFLSGILRIAKESIFSGLNNLTVDSIIDGRYSEYFGFTKTEVQQMSIYYHRENRLPEIYSWYDGYVFSDTEIFNPWSVTNYFASDCEAKPFWLSTGNSELFRKFLSDFDDEILESLEKLLKGESLNVSIETSIIYPEIQDHPAVIFSFLLLTGYLKAENINYLSDETFICDVSIPNREIKHVYRNEITRRLKGNVLYTSANKLSSAIFNKDEIRLKKYLESFLIQSVSFFDTAKESFYHGLMLGLLSVFDDEYKIVSNRESGYGRFDIALIPKKDDRPGILIELKAGKDLNEERLYELADEALDQIKNKKYDADLLSDCSKIFRYGVAFSGKNAAVCVK